MNLTKHFKDNRKRLVKVLEADITKREQKELIMNLFDDAAYWALELNRCARVYERIVKEKKVYFPFKEYVKYIEEERQKDYEEEGEE